MERKTQIMCSDTVTISEGSEMSSKHGVSVVDIDYKPTQNHNTLGDKDGKEDSKQQSDSVDHGWAWVVLLVGVSISQNVVGKVLFAANWSYLPVIMTSSFGVTVKCTLPTSIWNLKTSVLIAYRIGGFLISFFVVGGQKSFGILYVELSEKYQTSNKALSVTQSLAGFLQQFLGPVSAILSKRYPHRTLIFFGGLCTGGGIVLSSLAPSVEVLYLTYGIITGIGYGLCFSPSVVIIANYFNKYRAIASGISIAGGGLGGMVFPYLIQYLLREYGLRDALLVYGAIMLNICPCGLLMRPIQENTTKTNKQPTVLPVKPSVINTKTLLDDILTFKKQIMRAVHDLEWCLFKQWNSVVFFVVVFFAMFGYNSLFNIIPPYLDEIEFTKDDVAFVLLIFGLSDLIGRILFGFLMNVFPNHRHLLFTLTIFVFGSGFIGTHFIHTKLDFCVLLGCYGLFAGGYNGTLMVMAVENVDLDRLPSTWGFMCCSAAIAFLLNPVATGALKDSTGTWAHTFLLSGTMSLIAALILIFKSLKDRRNIVPKTETYTVSVERY